MTIRDIFEKTAKHFKMAKVDDGTYENDRFVLSHIHELSSISVRSKDIEYADDDTMGAFTYIEAGGYYAGAVYHSSSLPFIEYMLKLTEEAK